MSSFMSCLDFFDSVFHVIDFHKLTVLEMWGCAEECENMPGSGIEFDGGILTLKRCKSACFRVFCMAQKENLTMTHCQCFKAYIVL